MPIYDYYCVDCGARFRGVAGLPDITGLCLDCGGLMLRLDEDIFQHDFTSRLEDQELSRHARTNFPLILEEILEKIFPAEDRL